MAAIIQNDGLRRFDCLGGKSVTEFGASDHEPIKHGNVVSFNLMQETRKFPNGGYNNGFGLDESSLKSYQDRVQTLAAIIAEMLAKNREIDILLCQEGISADKIPAFKATIASLLQLRGIPFNFDITTVYDRANPGKMIIYSTAKYSPASPAEQKVLQDKIDGVVTPLNNAGRVQGLSLYERIGSGFNPTPTTIANVHLAPGGGTAPKITHALFEAGVAIVGGDFNACMSDYFQGKGAPYIHSYATDDSLSLNYTQSGHAPSINSGSSGIDGIAFSDLVTLPIYAHNMPKRPTPRSKIMDEIATFHRNTPNPRTITFSPTPTPIAYSPMLPSSGLVNPVASPATPASASVNLTGLASSTSSTSPPGGAPLTQAMTPSYGATVSSSSSRNSPPILRLPHPIVDIKPGADTKLKLVQLRCYSKEEADANATELFNTLNIGYQGRPKGSRLDSENAFFCVRLTPEEFSSVQSLYEIRTLDGQLHKPRHL